MVKLYKWSKEKEMWVFTDYGLKSKVDEYLRQGFIIFHY